MRRSRLVGVVMGSIPLAACFPPVERTPPPADAPPEILALAGAAVLIGAGDIATCPSPYDEATAALVDSVARADSAAGVEDAIFTLGDNVYPSGAKRYFDACWRPSWGDTSRRIMRVIRPAVGNHDLDFNLGADYYDLFGDKAGEAGRGYYSYDLGAWHVIVLNSNCSAIGGCAAGSAQERWLRADLAASAARCTVAIWHHPRFSSGSVHGNNSAVGGLWAALYDHGAELVVNGHEHFYERFAPQRPDGTADSAFGIRQITAGTGGKSLYGFGTSKPNSQVRNNSATGLLKLTLRADGYEFKFLPVAGKSFTDSGSGTCHDRR